MSKSITRCPKCHTAFRITDSHLNSAKGAVRCGSCLNIFNAKDFLISQNTEKNAKNTTEKAKASKASITPKKTVTSSAPKIATQQSGPAKTSTVSKKKPNTGTVAKKPVSTSKKSNHIDLDDDILISDDLDFEDDQDDAEDDIIQNLGFTKTKTLSSDFNLFERKTQSKEEDEETSDTDESWALDLLRDDKSTIKSNNASKPDTFAKAPTGRFSAFELIDTEKDTTPAEPAHKIEKVEAPSQPRTHQTTAEKIRAETAMTQQIFLDDENDFEPDYDSTFDESIDDSAYNTGSKDPKSSTNNQFYIDAIEPEPVEFSWIKHGGNIWYSNTFWLALCTLAFALAVGQLAYFKFDTLSRMEPYRNYYNISCKLLDCQLPALVDISKIRTANLVIRSHPKIEGELLVDAVLQNDAPFDQKFPSLDLIFTDINNQPIAAKRFKPSEYLAGELAGRTVMPSQQPIHIALQIEDPGPSAINYQMTISQAKN